MPPAIDTKPPMHPAPPPPRRFTAPLPRAPDPERAASAKAMREALARDFRHDPLSLALRALGLLAAYGLLAQAIAAHDLPAPLVLLPVAFETLVIMWFGWYLAHRVVDCPAFGRHARGLFAPLFWTALIGGGALAWLAFERQHETFQLALVPAAAADAADRATQAGLHLALAAMLAAMAASTWCDVRRWRRNGGVFVWSASLGGGLRIALAGLLAVPAILLGALLGPLAELAWPQVGDDPAALFAWGAFGALALLDAGALALGIALRRFLERFPDGPPPRD